MLNPERRTPLESSPFRSLPIRGPCCQNKESKSENNQRLGLMWWPGHKFIRRSDSACSGTYMGHGVNRRLGVPKGDLPRIANVMSTLIWVLVSTTRSWSEALLSWISPDGA